MTDSNNTENLPTVLILAGGLGTRLKSVVHDRPKALALSAGVPFLEIQLQWLSHHGFKNIVLLTGHKSNQIASYIGENTTSNLTVKIVCEQAPLGTRGAVINALKELTLSDIALNNLRNTSRISISSGSFLRVFSLKCSA